MASRRKCEVRRRRSEVRTLQNVRSSIVKISAGEMTDSAPIHL